MQKTWLYVKKLQLGDGSVIQKDRNYFSTVYFDEDGDYFSGGIRISERKKEDVRHNYHEVEAEVVSMVGAGWNGFFATEIRIININKPTKEEVLQ
jgi:hypothetical protein